MKRILCLSLVIGLLSGCNGPFNKTINGSGNVVTITRNIDDAHKIKCYGHYNIEIMQGSPSSLKITGDDNLLEYILTDEEDGRLVIKTKENFNLKSDKKVSILITTDRLDAFSLAGSGDVIGMGKFTGSNEMELNIAGSGTIRFDINSPRIKSSIAGSGDINLSGETKDAEINIAGTGNYNASDLKSENTKVDIAGSGDVKLFAGLKLEINIAGIGNVFYLGDPVITQKIAGTGKVQKLN